MGGAISTGGAAVDPDQFAHILEVTRKREALMAYYYLDDADQRVKVTEIFGLNEEEQTYLESLMAQAKQRQDAKELRDTGCSPILEDDGFPRSPLSSPSF